MKLSLWPLFAAAAIFSDFHFRQQQQKKRQLPSLCCQRHLYSKEQVKEEAKERSVMNGGPSVTVIAIDSW